MNILISKLQIINNKCFERYGLVALNLLLFLIPIKLSLSYICLIPLIICGCIYLFSSQEIKYFYDPNKPIVSLWLFFVIIAFISSGFGVDPLRSFSKVLELIFYSMSVPVLYYLIKKQQGYKFLIFLLLGQAVAGIHSILEFQWPETFNSLFVGTVSESGQITLSLLIGFGLAVYLKRTAAIPTYQLIGIFILLGIIFLALLLNLKRGPWAGVFAAGIVFFLGYRPKLILVFIPLVLVPIFFWPTLQERLANSLEHFYILGGRFDIWEVGVELAGRYPLGIGFGNSEVLREYSTVIPKGMDHFHSNYINILVETGMLGLFVFLWFWLSIFLKVIKHRDHLLLLSCVAGLIAWLTAGIVEYNFGDSEVMLLVYLTVALILVILNTQFREQQKVYD